MAKAVRVSLTPRSRTSKPARSQRCPVVGIMHQYAALGAARRRADDQHAWDRADELGDAIDILTGMASLTRARSLQGALFQLNLLAKSLTIIFSKIFRRMCKITFSSTNKRLFA